MDSKNLFDGLSVVAGCFLWVSVRVARTDTIYSAHALHTRYSSESHAYSGTSRQTEIARTFNE
jgi:hypothetical protein